MKKIILATHNKNKLFEFKEMFKDFCIEFILPSDLGIDEVPEENGSTFLENAKIKALHIASFTNLPVLSDDSGLIIDALPNILGIYSSRFMEGHSYEEKCKAIINMLKDNLNRNAHFVCSLCYIENKKEYSFEGVCEGTIIKQLQGEKGFGYDPIFVPLGYSKTYAQLSSEEKNSISHRGRAIDQFKTFLKKDDFAN